MTVSPYLLRPVRTLERAIDDICAVQEARDIAQARDNRYWEKVAQEVKTVSKG